MKIEIIGTVFACVMLWMLMVSVINMILLVLWKNRKPFVIKLPVKKKFKDGRLTPIYKIYQGDFTGDYYIEKWELKWDITDLTIFFMLIPFLYVSFNKFGYYLNDINVVIGNENDVNNMTGTIDDFYELKYAEIKKNEAVIDNKEKVFKDKLNQLNTTFIQNYTK